MKHEVRSTIVFAVTLFILSLVVWGGLEFSMTKGSMVDPESASYSNFIGLKISSYLLICLLNSVIYFLVQTRLSWKPGIAVTCLVAMLTIFLVIPLSYNSPFQIPAAYVGTVSFLISITIVFVLSRIFA